MAWLRMIVLLCDPCSNFPHMAVHLLGAPQREHCHNPLTRKLQILRQPINQCIRYSSWVTARPPAAATLYHALSDLFLKFER
ncbi:hypothetical protein CK203_083017 [Vitis vinifera]|uniref:Uncharacterized protein n=1 Tax=Vitis vinifera TaxID=29760 RepID=A0A438E559_VITVI|nr:hypothetical protein CK203_083017 [Vitis vinifera]